MQTKFLVTVMITFYNQEKYVDETLSSVFQQITDFSFEVIFGDDGSTDGTVNKLLRWKGKYPDRTIFLQMPRDKDKKYEPIVRASNNRYKMLQHAHGKYFIYLDGDDFYTDEKKLQKQVDILERYPECVACGHAVSYYWEDTMETKPLSNYCKKPMIFSKKTFWNTYYMTTDALMFRSNLSEEFIKHINEDIFDDNIITFYMLKFGDIFYLPDNMVNYRQIANSSWNSRKTIEKVLINLLDLVYETEIEFSFHRNSFYRHIPELRYILHERKSLNICDIQGDKQKLLSNLYIKDCFYYPDMNSIQKFLFLLRYAIKIEMMFVIKKVKEMYERFCISIYEKKRSPENILRL